MKMDVVSFLAVITKFPWVFRDAVTAALPKSFALIAFIRSPTVSVPVEVYEVVLEPAPTVIVPPARTPNNDSEVLVESDSVPVAMAGAADLPELDDEDAPELLDDEPVVPFSRF